MYYHVRGTVVILEGVSHPLICFPKCDMVVILRYLNGRNQDTAICSRV